MPVMTRMAMCPIPGASGRSQHRSSLRFYCCLLGGGSGSMGLSACGYGTGAPPSRQCQAALAVALRASIDRMSSPRS